MGRASPARPRTGMPAESLHRSSPTGRGHQVRGVPAVFPGGSHHLLHENTHGRRRLQLEAEHPRLHQPELQAAGGAVRAEDSVRLVSAAGPAGDGLQPEQQVPLVQRVEAE